MGELKEKLFKGSADFDPEKLTAEEKEVLEKYRSAGDKEKKAALQELKAKKVPKKLLSIASKMSDSNDQNVKTISVPFLAFTFFYSVSIYILMLSFYFWLWRTDIKPEKQ